MAAVAIIISDSSFSSQLDACTNGPASGTLTYYYDDQGGGSLSNVGSGLQLYEGVDANNDLIDAWNPGVEKIWHIRDEGGTSVDFVVTVSSSGFIASDAVDCSTVVTYTVTFDANGGTGTMAAQTAALPITISQNTFTRSGFNFSGWNTSSDGSGTSYTDEGSYNTTADVTLYAQWTAQSYTITFDANGGTGTMAAQTSTLPIAISQNTFTRNGYNFSGWNTSSDGSGTSYTDQDTYNITTDVTLYAQWSIVDQPPVANDDTITVGSQQTVSIDIWSLVSDDITPDSSLVFSLVSGPNDPNSLSAYNNTNGTINYTAPEVAYGNPDGSDSFTYEIEDEQGQTDQGTISITITAAANTNPVVNSGNSDSAISIQQNGGSEVIYVYASDNEQAGPLNFTISTPPTKGTANVVVGMQGSDTVGEIEYTPNQNEIGSDSFILTITDGVGGSTDWPISVTITLPSYIPFNSTIYQEIGDEACLLDATGQIWVASGGTISDVTQITIGTTLLQASAGNPYRPDTGQNAFIKLEDGVNTRYFEVDPNGQVVDGPLLCGVQSGLGVSSNVYYTASESLMCDGAADIVSVWYSVNQASAGATLATLIGSNIPLFTSEYWANLYANGLNSDLEGIIPAGLYAENTAYADLTATYTYYKRSTTNSWVVDSTTGSLVWKCPEPIAYDYYELANVQIPIGDPTDIYNICEGSFQNGSLWYPVAQDENGASSSKTLLELVQTNTPIYMSLTGAQQELISDMWPTGAFGTSDAYAVWNNEGDGVNFDWYAFDLTQDGLQFVEGVNATQLGNCDSYVRPTVILNEDLEWNSNVNDTNVFYAFLMCAPYFETDNDTGVISNYWQLYVVDGLYDIEHIINSDGSHEHNELGTSYVKEFVDQLKVDNPSGYFRSSGFGDCMQYMHKIYAEDINDAVQTLKNVGYESTYSDVEIAAVNPADIGLASEQTVEMFTNCYDCTNDNSIGSYEFPFVEDAQLSQLNPNFKTETNYKLDNVSKPLLRTNPKLTTNAKLVVSSTYKLYLESINATKELAAVEYKKFPVSETGQYSYDLARFFNVNRTPNEIMFATKRDYSDLTVQDSYDKQIEEAYHYGTTYNYSKLHDEEFRMFAPIWIDKNIPKNFVIFKVKNPSTVINYTDSAADNFGRIQSMLKNAEIVKTFDLTTNSTIGKYLRNHVQNETFPTSPITMSFEKNEKSTYNGIDLIKGGFTNKGEYLYKDFTLTDKPLIEANDFITDGFRRNQVASANVINLEFLFSDESADDYSANRYFGLYVDDIDSGKGRIFNINGKVHEFKELTSYVDANNPKTAIPSYKMISSMPILAYAKVDGNFFRLSTDTYYNANESKVAIEDSLHQIPNYTGIKRKGKSIDMLANVEHGYDFVKMSVAEVPNTNDSIAVSVIKEEANRFKFVKHVSNQSLTFSLVNDTDLYTFTVQTDVDLDATFIAIETAFNNEAISDYVDISFDDDSFYLTEKRANLGELSMDIVSSGTCIIKNTRIQTSVDFQNHVYFAEYSIQPGKFSGLRFSNQGSTTDVAVALAACINANESNFRAYNIGTNVYIVSTVPGYKLLQSAFLVSKNNAVDFIEVENRDFANILTLRKPEANQTPDGTSILEKYDAYYLSGGNSAGKSIFVNNETISEISIGDYIETRYAGVYNKVVDIAEDITRPNSQYSKIILEDKNDLKEGEANVFYENEIYMGLFSAYNIYDMNFDFYDTSNSDLKELVHETRSEINYEPYENALNSVDIDTGTETSALGSRDIFDDDFSLDPIEYFSNLSDLLEEESVDEVTAKQITSEFDRLKENQVKEFANRSRVAPNINKWVLKNSMTVREQPYYLNANEAFGRTNFAPDLTVSERDKDAMTHEWFYIEKMPKYLRYDQYNDTFSYVNFIEGFSLTPNMFKSVKYNYFDKFMISDGFEKSLTREDLIAIYDNIEVGDNELNSIDETINSFIKTELAKKYSIVSGGNDVSFASTIFKGIKVDFKNRKEFVNETASEFVKGNQFNGYKFSTLLKVNEDVDTNSIEFEVIQNKKFKFVIFFITLNLSEYWVKGNMNRKLLYELNHKIVYDTLEDDYIYANTPIEGALKLNDPNIDWNSEGPYTIQGISHYNGGQPNFESQVALGEGGLYGDIYIDIFPQTANQTTYKISVVSVESDSTLIISGKPVNINDDTDILQVEFLPSSVQSQAVYTYIGGGANAHKTILEELTAGNVADLVNLNNNLITYTTIEEDGTPLNNRFVINFSDGNEIVTKSYLTLEEDNDKPKSYKLFKGNIGYNIVQGEEYFPFLIRHNGSYTIDLNPVVTFTDVYTHFKVDRNQVTSNDNEWKFEEVLYKHSQRDLSEVNRAKAYYNRYNRCGVAFNLGFIQDNGNHDGNWGIIKNHFYHKVNEINPAGVTKLSTTSDKSPLYPLIGEVAIDKKDVNVFRSSWDFDYYNRSLAGGESITVPGTFETKEERSYLASTIMKPKELYTLLDYTWSRVGSEEELDQILLDGNNATDVVIFENDSNIIADFYISDVLSKKMISEGVAATIAKYVTVENSAGNKETLSDDAELYVKNNLINNYVLDEVDLYTRKFKGDDSKIVTINDVALVTEGGFTQDQNNYAYRSHIQKPMNFRLIYNKRLGYSYDIRPVIKIKS